MLPATRNSRPLVRITLPLTLPLASGPSSVTPVPFIAPLLQLRLFVSVRVAVPPNVPVPLSVRPAALLVPLMFKVPPLTARVGKVVLDTVAIVSVPLLLSRVPPPPRLPLAIVPVPPAFSRVAPLLTTPRVPPDPPPLRRSPPTPPPSRATRARPPDVCSASGVPLPLPARLRLSAGRAPLPAPGSPPLRASVPPLTTSAGMLLAS